MNSEESTTKVEELISTRVRKQVKLQKNQISLDKHLTLKLKNICAYVGPPYPTLGQMKAGIKSITN